MGVLVSGMGVGYLSKRWKWSSSDGSIGSGGGGVVGLTGPGCLGMIHEIIPCNECVIMRIYISVKQALVWFVKWSFTRETTT